MKHRPLARGDVLPASFIAALQEFIATQLANFALEKATADPAVAVRVPAAAGNGQVAVGIMGRWRYNSAPVTAAHPGGAASDYDVFATATDNTFSDVPTPDTDTTNYSFGLSILPVGSLPGTPLYRKVGVATWDGAAVTKVGVLGQAPSLAGDLTVGGRLYIPTPGAVAGILLGTDTNLYRDAADTLRTDDTLDIGGSLRMRGAALGLFGTAPVARNAGWGAALATNFPGAANRKALTAGYSENDLRDVVATLVDALRAYGLLGA